MTTIKQHLDSVKPKAHATQKKNGQYLKMTIQSLRAHLRKRNEEIKTLREALDRSLSRNLKDLDKK